MRAAWMPVVVAVAVVACGDPREGERCTFRGGLFTGSWICATGFVCNTGRDPKVCERPNVGGIGEPCGGDVNCRVELWCPAGLNVSCSARIPAGQPCPSGVGCEANLVCLKLDGGTQCAPP